MNAFRKLLALVSVVFAGLTCVTASAGVILSTEPGKDALLIDGEGKSFALPTADVGILGLDGSFVGFCLDPSGVLGENFTGTFSPVQPEYVARAISYVYTAWGTLDDFYSKADLVGASQGMIATLLRPDWRMGSNYQISIVNRIWETGNDSMAGLIVQADTWKGGQPISGITAAVPEPETYALMIAGLAAVGFVTRRRKA